MDVTLKNRLVEIGSVRGMSRTLPLFGLVLLAATSPIASAHFQLLYTPEAAVNESQAVPLALVFSHPFNNGYTMSMGEPEAFYVVSQRGAELARSTTDRSQLLTDGAAELRDLPVQVLAVRAPSPPHP